MLFGCVARVFLAVALVSAVYACPTGWVQHHEKCYHFSVFTGSWADCLDTCNDMSASMLCIDSTEDMHFISGGDTGSTGVWVANGDENQASQFSLETNPCSFLLNTNDHHKAVKYGYLAIIDGGMRDVLPSEQLSCSCQINEQHVYDRHISNKVKVQTGTVGVLASKPSARPSGKPISSPTARPTSSPTFAPTGKPTRTPSVMPTKAPTLAPSTRPTWAPTWRPTIRPTAMPTTARPTHEPPSAEPTAPPTRHPTRTLTAKPSISPTAQPTAKPTLAPTCQPSRTPTCAPTTKPTSEPSLRPTSAPIDSPTARPSPMPTIVPTRTPTFSPSTKPTTEPSIKPTRSPSIAPSPKPSVQPSISPSAAPVIPPSVRPTSAPTVKPTPLPSLAPSPRPTAEPSMRPTRTPTQLPTTKPTLSPTAKPTISPTTTITAKPTVSPTTKPTIRPTGTPTIRPTSSPTVRPTIVPSTRPSTRPTKYPTALPTRVPSRVPTVLATDAPSLTPTLAPVVPPSAAPTHAPVIFDAEQVDPPVSHAKLQFNFWGVIVSQMVQGVSYLDYVNNRFDFENVLKMSIADSMEGITTNDIYNLVVTAGVTTAVAVRDSQSVAHSHAVADFVARNLRSNPRPLATGDTINLAYTVQVMFNGLTYIDLSTQLINAVEGGAFNDHLHTHAVAQEVPVLVTAFSSAVTTEQVSTVDTNSDGGNSDGKSSTLPIIIGAVVGGVCLVLAAIFAWVFLCLPLNTGTYAIVKTFVSSNWVGGQFWLYKIFSRFFVLNSGAARAANPGNPTQPLAPAQHMSVLNTVNVYVNGNLGTAEPSVHIDHTTEPAFLPSAPPEFPTPQDFSYNRYSEGGYEESDSTANPTYESLLADVPLKSAPIMAEVSVPEASMVSQADYGDGIAMAEVYVGDDSL